MNYFVILLAISLVQSQYFLQYLNSIVNISNVNPIFWNSHIEIFHFKAIFCSILGFHCEYFQYKTTFQYYNFINIIFSALCIGPVLDHKITSENKISFFALGLDPHKFTTTAFSLQLILNNKNPLFNNRTSKIKCGGCSCKFKKTSIYLQMDYIMDFKIQL